MVHMALCPAAGLSTRAGVPALPGAQQRSSTSFGSRSMRSAMPGHASLPARKVAAGAWWDPIFGKKSGGAAETAAADGPLNAAKEPQDAVSPTATSFKTPEKKQKQQPAPSAPAPATLTPPPVRSTATAAAAAASAAPPAAANAPAGPAATSFKAPAAAAAGKSKKGGKRKGKKVGKARKAAADVPAATSFRVPDEAAVSSGSESETEAEEQQGAEEQSAAAAAPVAAAAAAEDAGGSNGSNGSSGSGSAKGRQVITLTNSSLTVNSDGSISISGADTAKVLEALAAVGVVPGGSSGANGNGAAASSGNGSVAVGTAQAVPLPAVPVRESTEMEYLTARTAKVSDHFPGAIGADDFIQRVEMTLYAFGFTGENSIAMVNLCRDEVTVTLKQKIDAVFGASFSTNGLGGVLTCGTIGMGAGFSHSPVCAATGKERYVFFSFPHISINSRGEVGPMSRPGRPEQSCACGALIKSWNELRTEGLNVNCKIPGVHDAVNPEYSILKQRIARRLRHEGETDESVKKLTLTDITKVAERTISDDLEFLISKTVDTTRADYAVITGVQVHNWAHNFEDDSPNVEFVAPTSAYVVVNGLKTHLDLAAMPPLTPRQIRLLHGGSQDVVCNTGGTSTLREEDAPYAYDNKDTRKVQRQRLQRYVTLLKEEGLEEVAKVPPPGAWRDAIVRDTPIRCALTDNSTVVDRESASRAAVELKEIQEMLQQKYKEQSA